MIVATESEKIMIALYDAHCARDHAEKAWKESSQPKRDLEHARYDADVRFRQAMQLAIVEGERLAKRL